MKKIFPHVFVVSIVLGMMPLLSSGGLAADMHLIVGTQQVSWAYNGQRSTPVTPLVVDDLKIGDILAIQINAGPIPHGFITTKKNQGGQPAEDKDLIQACGQTNAPSAVLREMDCDAVSKVGVRFTGTMRLEVLGTFKEATDFWCVVHHGTMAGTLKLKGAD